MVTPKEYEAYLKVKRFIDGHDESEIISRLMGDNKYVPLIIKSDDADLIKYYSTSAAARHCGVTKQTLDYVKLLKNSDLANVELVKHSMKREIKLGDTSYNG